jgi:hypothetical protein
VGCWRCDVTGAVGRALHQATSNQKYLRPCDAEEGIGLKASFIVTGMAAALLIGMPMYVLCLL